MAICAYFAVFATSAFAAAEPARTADYARCDAANVSGDVTSHVRHDRPCAQGIIVTPSGRLWSDRLRPVGSLVDEGYFRAGSVGAPGAEGEHLSAGSVRDCRAGIARCIHHGNC